MKVLDTNALPLNLQGSMNMLWSMPLAPILTTIRLIESDMSSEEELVDPWCAALLIWCLPI